MDPVYSNNNDKKTKLLDQHVARPLDILRCDHEVLTTTTSTVHVKLLHSRDISRIWKVEGCKIKVGG